MFYECDFGRHKGCDGGAILFCVLFQIEKCHKHLCDIVFWVVLPLSVGLLTFLQVGLCRFEVCLERRPGLFLIQLGAQGPAVYLKISCLCNEAVCDVDDLSLCYWLTRCSFVINAPIKPLVEDFEWFIGILCLPELYVVLR